jgi:hypothetical protein
MKYSLIFSGIPESEDRQAENCETTIKNFINKDLGVEGDVEFQNVHEILCDCSLKSFLMSRISLSSLLKCFSMLDILAHKSSNISSLLSLWFIRFIVLNSICKVELSVLT